MPDFSDVHKFCEDTLGRPIREKLRPQIMELVQNIAALRPITREQVGNEWKGEWIGMTDDDGCTWYECSRCEHDLDSLEDPNHFCPACGAPMTDEAVDMVMERLEALRDE